MKLQRRLLVTVISLAVLVSALILPFGASAGQWLHQNGKMMVPRDITEPKTLRVGQFGVTVYPGSMPKGGPVVINAWTAPDGQFRVQFTPERGFDAPVMLDFGTAGQVVYESKSGGIVLSTSDLDKDGQVGEVWSDHFSRYSGW